MPAPAPGSAIKKLALRYTLTLNGTALSDKVGLISANVFHEVNKISHAEFVLSGDSSIVDTSKSFTDDDSFSPGNTVSFTTGYGDSDEVSIFDGIILKHSLEVTKSSNFNLKLICKHKAISMTFGRKEQEYKDKTDSAIITSITSNYNVSATIDSTSFQNELFFQKQSTDWDLVLSRAEFNGFIITMDGTGMKIGKPVLTGNSALRVAFGESIIDFQAELSAERQAPSIEAIGWDIASLATQKSTAAEPSLNSQGNMTAKTLSGRLSQVKTTLSSLTPMSKDELQSWADGYLLRMRLSAVKGKVTFIGSPAVKTGGLIDLEGVSKKFNGTAFVSSVTHKLSKATWETSVNFGLQNKLVSELPDYSSSPAAGQVPAISGLQVGTVKQLSEDPQSLYRVLVNIPSSAETANGVWARYANFYGSNGVGLGFLPEVGDEVVLGFVESDPRYPVILGSLYGSKNVPPNPATDEKNSIKSLTTKSKMVLQFDDDKKVITIKTPGANMITISDEDKSIEIKDQNSNVVKLSDSGIDFTSQKDINIKATGSINIDATQKLTLSAKQDLTGSGLNVSLKANVGMTAKGTATAEFSASGQTTIKGGMVMIN